MRQYHFRYKVNHMQGVSYVSIVTSDKDAFRVAAVVKDELRERAYLAVELLLLSRVEHAPCAV